MRISKLLAVCLVVVVCSSTEEAAAQGTSSFQNLNFESANLLGYSPGVDQVPTTAALPGWSAFYGSSPSSTVAYDGISLGGAVISILDARSPTFAPLNGNYSACLFGAGGQFPDAVTISQTGLVSANTRSLFVNMWWDLAPPLVKLDGQTI